MVYMLDSGDKKSLPSLLEGEQGTNMPGKLVHVLFCITLHILESVGEVEKQA